MVNMFNVPSVGRSTKLATLAVVVIPFLGVIGAMLLLWGNGFHWADLIAFAVLYVGTGIGVTLGFHRLFTHRSFETVRPIKYALGILGSMSAEGPLLHWTADHRRHHQYSDGAEDPHSPHGFGEGAWAVLRGFWHSHMGWLFTYGGPEVARYAPDLQKDRGLKLISDLFLLWVALGLVIPAVVGGLVMQSWMGALSGFLWGGLVRLFLVHHATWSINSVCHLWGQRPYESADESRNNFFFGVIGFGEGWHNNHHAFPTSARHGLKWWQVDVTYLLLCALVWCGLAWKVRLPSPEALAAKAINAGGPRFAAAAPPAESAVGAALCKPAPRPVS